MIKAANQIIPNQQDIVRFLKENGVVKAGIFGSFARGVSNKRSDIDILVKLKEGLSLLDLVGLERELQRRLKKKIDLLTYDSIHPALKKRILQEQIPIL